MFAVVLTMAVVFSPMVGSEDSDAAGVDEYYKYTMTTSLAVTDASGTAMTAISRTSDWTINAGSWGFNSDGYGPFNSYYAAINPTTGKVLCHLDPNNLAQSVDGETAVDGVAISNCNIMWVLPTVYIANSGNNLVMTNDPTKAGVSNAQAYAHTISGETYNYLALGVYEAYYDNSKLMSKSGVAPTTSTTLINFRDYANNNTVDGGYAMIWNWHQYEIYRLCSLAVMESFDSQTTVGYGNSSGGSKANTGGTDSYGPYAGSSASNTKGVKLFIENAWGNVFDYLDDCYWNNGTIYAGQNTAGQSTGTTLSTWSGGTSTGYTAPDSGWGTGCSTNLKTWGMPTSVASSNSTSAPDYLYKGTNTSAPAVHVGGNCSNYANAGLSYVGSSTGGSASNGGSRLAMVFDADPAATKSVTYDHSQLTDLSGDATLANGLDQKMNLDSDTTQYYPDYGVQGGIYTHIGWSTGNDTTVEYQPGATITNKDNHTVYSVWSQYGTLTYNYDALESSGLDDSLIASLPTAEYIYTDGTTTYDDLNSRLGEYIHLGWYVDGVLVAPGAQVTNHSSHTAYIAVQQPMITITFMVEGSVHSTLEVPKNSVGIVYTPKQVTGVFMGWYYDETYTNKYDSTQRLNADTTLYAKGVRPLEFTSTPVANATITNVDAHGLVYFDATDSTGRSSVLWDFGDGNTSTDPIAYNSYAEPGTYTVTLTVTNADGQSDVRTYQVVTGETSSDDSGDKGWGIAGYFAIAISVVLVGYVVARRFL